MAVAGAEENRNIRNDQLINEYMKKTLKTIAMALLLTAATVTAGRASTSVTPVTAGGTATLYQALNVNLVLTYYQTEGATNATTGEITYTAGNLKLTTAEFLQLLATNLGISSLDKHASLMRVTHLYPGTNFATYVTNQTTLLPGNTVITNIEIPMTLVWQCNTNSSLFFTNTFPNSYSALPFTAAPNTNNSSVTNNTYTKFYSAGNFTTFVIQGKAESVMLGSAQYYIINGSDISDTNIWVPLYDANTTASVSVFAVDQAGDFQNWQVSRPVWIDDKHSLTDPTGLTNYFGDVNGFGTNVVVGMAGLVTNLNYNAYVSGFGPVFVGYIKTNMSIAGTLYGDSITLDTGDSDQPIGMPSFLTGFHLYGTGNATAVTHTVGSGKAALPFTSWNATFDFTNCRDNYAILYGYDTNTINTNFFYYYADASATTGGNIAVASLEESPGFTEPGVGATVSTNPPVAFTNSFTYVSGTFQPMVVNVGEPDYVGLTPPITNTVPVQIVTPDLTGYYVSNVVYTNGFTNVYTLNTNDDNSVSTNFSIYGQLTNKFAVTGMLKQTFVKITTP
jgi:hypothetical protein